MPLIFAGITAVSFGVADFFGGIAARRWPPMWVAAAAQVVGLPILLPLLLFLPGTAPVAVDLGWGALAGVTSGIGIMLLYRALAAGPMNVAAPTAAVVSSVVPVVTGLLLGERPGAVALGGVVCGLIAVAVVGATAPEDEERGPSSSLRTGVISVVAGVLLGTTAVIFGQSTSDAGLWPLVAARTVASAMLGVVIVVSARPERAAPGEPSGRRLALLTGVVDTIGSVFLVLALQRGLLTLVPVIASLYPAFTVLLARFVLQERIGRTQAVGLGLAGAAIVLIGIS